MIPNAKDTADALSDEKKLYPLLKQGPELDAVEASLPPDLRGWLVEGQKYAADSYAAGTWTVEATGKQVTVPHLSNPDAIYETSFFARARHSFRVLMGEFGLGRNEVRGL